MEKRKSDQNFDKNHQDRQRKSEFSKLRYTDNQENYIRTIIDSHVTICNGPQGTGKTLLALIVAANQLRQGNVEKILVSRSLVGVGGREIGFMPGDLESKADPYFVFIKSYLKEIFDSEYENYIKHGKIQITPIEVLRGHTYHNTFMILEEASNCTPTEIKMFIGRMGRNSKCVILGDTSQKDTIYGDNGLAFCMKFLGPEDNPIRGCGIATLTYDDVKRNPEVKHILQAFDDNGA